VENRLAHHLISVRPAVIPFRLTFEPGMSLYEQVIYAAKKAIVSGKLKGGDPFPDWMTVER